MEPFTVPLLSQSREIFVVCTPDIASLHFARTKAQFLRASGFGDRSSVLLNRSGMPSQFSVADLEKLVGLRIRFSLQNDPRCVSDAMRAGTSVNPKSVLGRQFDALAESIVGIESHATPPSRKRRFIEYFAIVPSMRDTVGQKPS
jgi:Flp pilus assembly CpaE family ATPase